MKTRIAEKFQTMFQTEGDFFASAGRINLIGEHTDYNGGFVFPGAVDKGIVAAIKLNGTELDGLYITHDQLMNGGELVFTMSDKA